jgi:Phosphopantothenoylcysteine synthetase/decarboxylase
MIKVNSAKEMYDATMDNLPVDIAIFSAAVSDWKIENFNKEKIKKNGDLNLSLVQNIDILSNISKNNSLRPKLVIGFAAETDNLVENSKKKLDEKNCDWIIANDVSNNEIGFDSDYNEITIFYRNKNLEKISKMKKSLIADKIVERVISDLN